MTDPLRHAETLLLEAQLRLEQLRQDNAAVPTAREIARCEGYIDGLKTGLALMRVALDDGAEALKHARMGEDY